MRVYDKDLVQLDMIYPANESDYLDRTAHSTSYSSSASGRGVVRRRYIVNPDSILEESAIAYRALVMGME